MEYVYQVYKEGSFLKASEKLFISQPSISASVRRIEERIGCQLFDRSVKPLQLTECGARYISCVEKIMALEHEFSEYVNDWDGLKRGKLILGGSSLFSSLVLPPLMAVFRQKYPQIQVELVEETTAKGRASVAPSTEPRMDILMVSTSGPITLGRKLQSGWKICFRITVN